MKDIFAFIADIPWWVWVIGMVWYFLVCLRKEHQKFGKMTPDERAEYRDKLRRKQLGLD